MGYEEYTFHTVSERPGTFVFYERWSSGPDLLRHAQQPFMIDYFNAMSELVEPTFDVTYLRPLDAG